MSAHEIRDEVVDVLLKVDIFAFAQGDRIYLNGRPMSDHHIAIVNGATVYEVQAARDQLARLEALWNAIDEPNHSQAFIIGAGRMMTGLGLGDLGYRQAVDLLDRLEAAEVGDLSGEPTEFDDDGGERPALHLVASDRP